MTDAEIIAYLKDFYNTDDRNRLKILADSMLMHLKNDPEFLRAFIEDTPENNEIIEAKIMQMLKYDSEEDLIYQAIIQADDLNQEIMDGMRKAFNDHTLDSDTYNYFDSHKDELRSNHVPQELYGPLYSEPHDSVLPAITRRVLARYSITTMRPSKPH